MSDAASRDRGPRHETASGPDKPPIRFDPRVFARLAKLELSADEESRYAREFGVLLEYFSAISRVNTENVEPMVYPIVQAHRERPDEPRLLENAKEILANAPGVDGGEFFRVPKVIEA